MREKYCIKDYCYFNPDVWKAIRAVKSAPHVGDGLLLADALLILILSHLPGHASRADGLIEAHTLGQIH